MKNKLIILFLIGVLVSGLAFSQEKVSPIDSCLEAAKQFEANSDLYNSALTLSDGIKIARKTDKSKLPELLMAYCRALTYLGDYSGALLNLEEAESLAPQGNESFRGRIMTAYGTIYFYQGNFSESLKYYQEALVCAENNGKSLGISIAQTNLACVYGELKEYDKAIEMLTKSLAIQEEANDLHSACNSLYNIALCHMDMKNYDEGAVYLNRAMEVAKSVNNKEILALCIQGLARIQIIKNNFDEGERLLNESEKIAFDNHFRQALLNIYSEKREFYVTQSRYREAYEYLSKYQEFSDSLFSEDTKNKLNSQRIKFELREKELQIEEQKNTSEQQNMIIIILCVVSG